MDRCRRVRSERRRMAMRAYERWKGTPRDLVSVPAGAGLRREAIARPRVAVPSVQERARFERRESMRAVVESTAYRGMRIAVERQIGATLDFADLPPNEQALKAGRPVARIVTMPGSGLVPQGFATGFLVSPDLILTNHHVFRAADEARGVGAQFLYERTRQGLREGIIFECDPQRFFVNDRDLDYALVAIKPIAVNGVPLGQFQCLPLIAATGKIQKGDPVNVIQHPSGDPKQYATVNNQLLDLRDDGFLLYETDTLEGSSGAPVFNQHWETIGLHHCGVPQIENGMLVRRDGTRVPLDSEVADSDLIWVANEGVRVSALVASLAQQRPDRPGQRELLEKLLALTRDPLPIIVEKAGAAPLSADSNTLTMSEDTMSQTIFQFTGPVTINVSAPTNGFHGNGVGSIDQLPEATVQIPFREKKLKFDEDYKKRTQQGYDPSFLKGWKVPAPTVTAARAAQLLEAGGKPWVIPYYHFSLVMNEKRRLMMWAASNVDYSPGARKYTRTRKEYGGEDWRLDPRVALDAPGLQIEDADFYKPATKIDRGHIVRREDSAWGGNTKEAEYGNSDTYHWTNCTPQSEAFNQSGQDGIWGQFEEHIQREVKAEGGRMCVMAGPVLNPDDPEHGYDNGSTIQVPMEFWKVVACVSKENGKTVKLAYGFVFDQTEAVQRLGYERMDMDDYAIYQMPIAEITKKTGVVFDDSVRKADVLGSGGAPESIRGFKAKPIAGLESIVLR